ncbi:MAG: FAD-binding protein [Salinarimonas sp.]
MLRRDFFKAGVSLAAASCVPAGASGATVSAAPSAARRVRPYDPDWPSASDWRSLADRLGGRLSRVASPLDGCARTPDGTVCDSAWRDLANPFHIQDLAGATQTAGWVDAWTSAPSVYAAEPETAQEVAAVVRFAAEKNLRLVVKGGAHSYLGQSNAPDSLLLWTRRMDAITVHDDFLPLDCDGVVAPVPAVSVGSGAKFIQLYDAVTTKAGRFVQGGGCTSVGVGGHVQTGGFGSFSKYGGLAAASLLEAEIVTADGTVRVVNACRDPELFAALRGGGAGFGVTTRLTLATRPMPDRCGFLGRTVRATSRAAFERLVEAFCAFAGEALVSPHWGEQVFVMPDDTLEIAMVFQGLSDDEAARAWAPFDAWLAAHPDDVAEATTPRIVSMPGRHWWDYAYRRTNHPQSIVEDDRPGAAPGRFWWSGNASEVGIYLSGYESLWLPERLLAPETRGGAARALVAASRAYAVGLHFNKGLAGATPERRAEARETAIHPSAHDAFALAIIAGGATRVHPGILGHEPDREAQRAEAERIAAAMAALRSVAPEAGSYSSEMSFFEPNWQDAAWGPNYAALLATKERYDPDGLFTGHHQVGSERWSADGFARRG